VRVNNLNSILIEGRLTEDPKYQTTPKGTPLCTFTLASTRYYKAEEGNEKEVSFFAVEAWAKLAENICNLGRKGRGARVVGRIKEDRWEDTEGKSHSRVIIVAEHLEFNQKFTDDCAKRADEEEKEEELANA
jgi:single-strand DNA-binding protein